MEKTLFGYVVCFSLAADGTMGRVSSNRVGHVLPVVPLFHAEVEAIPAFMSSYSAIMDVADYFPIVAALPFIAIAFAMFAMLPRTLNLLSVGAESAADGGRHRL